MLVGKKIVFLQTNLTHILLLPNIWNILLWHTWYTWCNERLETSVKITNVHNPIHTLRKPIQRRAPFTSKFPREKEREDSRGMNKLPRFVRWPRCGRKPRAKHERFVIASRLPRQTWRFRNRLHLMKFRDIGQRHWRRTKFDRTCIQNSLFNFLENRYLKFFSLEIINAILPLHLFSTLSLFPWDKIIQLNTWKDTTWYLSLLHCPIHRGYIHDFLFDRAKSERVRAANCSAVLVQEPGVLDSLIVRERSGEEQGGKARGREERQPVRGRKKNRYGRPLPPFPAITLRGWNPDTVWPGDARMND